MTQIDAVRLAGIKSLRKGIHQKNDAEMCVMEAVAYVTGEPWSDTPECASPVITSFCVAWNDGMNDEDRNRLLKPLIPLIVGTRTTTEDDETRAWMATDWLVRVHTPAWLRLAGLVDEARALEATARIVDAATCAAAQPTLAASRTKSAAARDTAWAAAYVAARAAAWDTARADAWDTARAAAYVAAWAAAGAAAGDAARAAARDAAGAAAGAAAWDAARDAAWAAAGAAAGAAAWDALQPTVQTLQESAAGLLQAMCAVGRK